MGRVGHVPLGAGPLLSAARWCSNRRREELKVDWQNLQRPGFSADYVDDRYEQIDLAYRANDWVPTAAGTALLRNNQPVLAYLAGKPDAFTSKDHNFLPGETVEKQIIVINNSRRPSTPARTGHVDLPQPPSGRASSSCPPASKCEFR